MPEYLSPGVYVEEVPSGAAPIAGVSTSIGGFIGKVVDDVEMPEQPGKFETDADGNPVPVRYSVATANEPQLITGWGHFRRTFGDIQAGNSTLAHAVFGFFNNGGSRCWATRVNADVDATNVGAALSGFQTVDEITIVAVPGAQEEAVQVAVIDHCENMGDRFAILDGQQNPVALTTAAIKGGVRDSDYAALYFPWIEVADPVTGGNAFIPPSGHMAGIYARVDSTRGIHKAPANEVIRGVVGLERRLGKADQDGLNPDGINVIRNFRDNPTVWGARTLGGDANTEWKYINVRRLFLFLRESIDEGTQWVVFEPNTPDLWGKITVNVTAFLTGVWRSGALFGASPAEAFFVRCDSETNPPDVRDLGQVVTEIGVAVVKPAEFVIFRISQMAARS